MTVRLFGRSLFVLSAFGFSALGATAGPAYTDRESAPDDYEYVGEYVGTIGYSPCLLHGVTGKGLNDYDAIFSILASVGYSGWISIEDGMNGMGEMEESLRFLKRKVEQYYPEG